MLTSCLDLFAESVVFCLILRIIVCPNRIRHAFVKQNSVPAQRVWQGYKLCLIRAPRQNEVTKFVIRCRPEQKDINLDILGAPALALSGIRGRKPSEWASKTPSSILSPQRRPNKRHRASKGHFDACLKRRIAVSGDPTHLVLSIVYPHFVKDVSGSAHTDKGCFWYLCFVRTDQSPHSDSE